MAPEHLIERDFAPDSLLLEAKARANAATAAAVLQEPVPIVVQGWSLQQTSPKKRLLVPFTLPSEPRPEVAELQTGVHHEREPPTNTPYAVTVTEVGGFLWSSVNGDPSKPKKGSFELLLEPVNEGTSEPPKKLPRRKSVFLRGQTSTPSAQRSQSVAAALSLSFSAISTARLEPPFSITTLYHRKHRAPDSEQTITRLNGYGARPMYNWNNVESLIQPEDQPKVRTKISYQWRGLGPSGTVLEVVEKVGETGIKEMRQNCAECRIALFIYTSDIAQQIDPESGKRRLTRFNEVGELYITRRGIRHYPRGDGTDRLEIVQTDEEAVEHLLGSLVAIVEMAKRWRYLR